MEGTKYMEDARMPQPGDDEADLSDETVEEFKAFDKGHFEITWTGLDKVKCAEGARVVVAGPGCPQALLRILFDDNLQDLATASAKSVDKSKTEKKDKEPEAKEVLKVQSAGDLIIISPQEAMSSKHVGQLIASLQGGLVKPTVIGLSTVYKTNYTTSEGHMILPHDQDYTKLPIRYVKSSHANGIIDNFVAQKHPQVSVDTQYNFTGGLTAGLLMEAEMYGLGAIAIK